MRLADVVLRGGHLSEQTLVDVCMTGERPAHLDRCDICADRAVDLGRWLEDVRVTANGVADTAFPAERLLAQQAQVMRRLEQLDQPSRIIAFPSHARLEERQASGRRIAPAWIGVAAAAGLLIGVLGDQLSARFTQPPAAPIATATTETAQAATAESLPPQTAAPDWSRISQLEEDSLEHPTLSAIQAINVLTPRVVQDNNNVMLASYSVPAARAGGR